MKHYTIRLTMLGPVYLGSNRKIRRREYVFEPETEQIYVMDMVKVFRYFRAHELLDQYETYLLQSGETFTDWVKTVGLDRETCRQLAAYVLDAQGMTETIKRQNGIWAFVKDAYGCPYVPGTVVKGALRTALMAFELLKSPETFDELRKETKEQIRFAREVRFHTKTGKPIRITKGKYLREQLNQLNELCGEERKYNSVFRGLLVSDSRPIDPGRLMVTRRIDTFVDGTETTLEVLRECLKPGTVVELDLSIDETIFPYSVEEIRQAIRCFLQQYNAVFLSKFSTAEMQDSDVMYLGGGTGFVSKTVLYPLLGDDEAVEYAALVQEQFLSPQLKQEHHHEQDKDLGVSPHIIKQVQCGGDIRDMGAVRVEIR